jgi:hypothetical protein
MSEYLSRTGNRRLFCSLPEFRLTNDLPYGIWLCAGGREVLFNRFYEPIYDNVERAAVSLARSAQPPALFVAASGLCQLAPVPS